MRTFPAWCFHLAGNEARLHRRKRSQIMANQSIRKTPTLLTSLSSLALVASLTLGACATESVPKAQTAQGELGLSFEVFTGDEKGFYANSTLISGEEKAILVDAQFTLGNGERLASWIEEKGVDLAAIYITHAHPDHYFGVEKVLEKFPNTPMYATTEVVEHMKVLGPQKLAYWGPIYQEDLTAEPITATPDTDSFLELEGKRVEFLPLEQSDSEFSTAVHVPSLELIVAGDLVYSGVHTWLADTPSPEQRTAWLETLTRIGGMKPKAVVPGHSAPGTGSTPSSLTATRGYISDFERLRTSSSTAEELISAMMEEHGDDKLPVILELAAKASFAPVENP